MLGDLALVGELAGTSSSRCCACEVPELVVDCRRAARATASPTMTSGIQRGRPGVACRHPGAADGPAAPAAATGLQGLDSSALPVGVTATHATAGAVVRIGTTRIDAACVDSLARWIARCRRTGVVPARAIRASPGVSATSSGSTSAGSSRASCSRAIGFGDHGRRARPRRARSRSGSRSSASSAAGSSGSSASAAARAGARCAPTSAWSCTLRDLWVIVAGVVLEIALGAAGLPIANLVQNQHQGVVKDLETAHGLQARAARPVRGPDRAGLRGAAVPGPAPAGAAPPVLARDRGGRLGARVRAGAPVLDPTLGDLRHRARPVRPGRGLGRGRRPPGRPLGVDHAAHRLQPAHDAQRRRRRRPPPLTVAREWPRLRNSRSVLQFPGPVPTTPAANGREATECTFAQDVRKARLITIRMRIAGREVVFHRCARCEVEQLAGRRRRVDARRGPGARSSPALRHSPAARRQLTASEAR